MAVGEFGYPQVGSLIGAALETAGAYYQSEILKLVNGAGGQTLAGLLFLFAIVAGIITFAIGGSYKWGRFLLIGPSLFFFLTQVPASSSGTLWQFGNEAMPDDEVKHSLRGVGGFDGKSRQPFEVALFYQWWNVFTSAITQDLIRLVNVTKNGSHTHFINKIERYMNIWKMNHIKDPNLRALIRAAMIPNCGRIYMLMKEMTKPGGDNASRMKIEAELNSTQDVVILIPPQGNGQSHPMNELWSYMKEKLITPPEGASGFTCKTLWKSIVSNNNVRKEIFANITKSLSEGTKNKKAIFDMERMFYMKIKTFTTTASQHLNLSTESLPEMNTGGVPTNLEDRAVQEAVDWVLAHSLWMEFLNPEKDIDMFLKEGQAGIYSSPLAGGSDDKGDWTATASDIIRGNNYSDYWQYKGDYVNMALALPHFQAVGLFLLSIVYPFFAMLVVVPNKAGSFLIWMGLFAWLKLWDFGFAVVMMIDNILFAFFPRGPSIPVGEIENAGMIWQRVLQVDPSYAASTYYNLIATCLFAVPVCTGLILKKGGSELMGMLHSSATNYSSRLAGAPLRYALALRDQSSMGNLNKAIDNFGRQYWEAFRNTEEYQKFDKRKEFLSRAKALADMGAMDKLTEFLQGNNVPLAEFGKFTRENFKAYFDGQLKVVDAQREAAQRYVENFSRYSYSASRTASYASERMVYKMSTHCLLRDYPVKDKVALLMCDKWAITRDKVYSSSADSLLGTANKVLGNRLGGVRRP